MAKDPHANAWIKSLKEGKKQVEDLTNKYITLFQEDKMTKKDLQEYKQLYPKAKQVADQMWKGSWSAFEPLLARHPTRTQAM